MNDGGVLSGFVAGYEAALERIGSGWDEVHSVHRAQGADSVRAACSFFGRVPSDLRYSLYHMSLGEARSITRLLLEAGVLDAGQHDRLCGSFGNLVVSRSGRYRALYDRGTDTPYLYIGSPDYSTCLEDRHKEEALFSLYCKFHEYWHLVLHILSASSVPDGKESVVSAASVVAGEAFAMKGPLVLARLLYAQTGLEIYKALGMTYYPAEDHSDPLLKSLWSRDKETAVSEFLSYASTPYLAYVQDLYSVETIDSGYYAQLRFFDRLLEDRGFDLQETLRDLLDHYEVTDVTFSDYTPAGTMEDLSDAIEAIVSGSKVERGIMKLMATCSDGTGPVRERAAYELYRLGTGEEEKLSDSE